MVTWSHRVSHLLAVGAATSCTSGKRCSETNGRRPRAVWVDCSSNHTPVEWSWAPTLVKRFPGKAHRPRKAHLTMALFFREDLERPSRHFPCKKSKRSPYSITERRVPEQITVLGSQPASGVSRKPGGRLPLLSARPAVTPAALKRTATNFAAW